MMMFTLLFTIVALAAFHNVVADNFADLRDELSDFLMTIPVIKAPTKSSYKPVKDSYSTSAKTYYSGFYTQFTVDEVNNDCSGKEAAMLATKLNQCTVQEQNTKKMGVIGQCALEDPKVYMDVITFSTSMACDSTVEEPSNFPSYHYSCGSSQIKYTLSHSTCNNATATEVASHLPGVTLKLYGTGHSAATCTESELTSIASWSSDYCQKIDDQEYGTIYRRISCSKSEKRIITNFYTDAKCTITARKPGKKFPVPPFNMCYDASLLIPLSEQKMIPTCSLA